MITTCNQCNKEFEMQRKQQKYCGKKCANKAYNNYYHNIERQRTQYWKELSEDNKAEVLEEYRIRLMEEK